MAQVLAAVATFEKAKSAYDSMRGGDPGIAPLQDAETPQAQGQDLSGSGFAMANPQPTMAPPLSAPDQAAPQTPMVAPQQAAPQQPIDNPYAQDTAKEIGNSLGSNSGEDVTVTGDTFKPKKESVLGVIGDFLLMRRGMQPIFRQRTEEANMKEALKGFQRDPASAISRVRQIDPELAFKMQQQLQASNANNALEQERRIEIQDKGVQRIGGMLGAVQNSKDPAAIYAKTLPTMRRWAETYGIDPSSLPDTYDADAVNGFRSGAISPYQQESLSQRDQARQDLNTYRQSSLNDLNEHRQNTEAETNRHNLVIEAKPSGSAAKPVARNVFGEGGRFAGKISPDGRSAALQGDDGNWYAYRLRTPGDIGSRVRSPAEDAAIRKAMGQDK